jgi:hypothetical protein
VIDPTPTLAFYEELSRRKLDATIKRTPNPDCAACQTSRLHKPADWVHHPDAGTGIIDGKFFGRQA